MTNNNTFMGCAAVRREMWTVQDVSDYLGVPVGTLINWRSSGKGPQYLKISAHVVRYLPEDVDEWLLSRRTMCTSGE